MCYSDDMKDLEAGEPKPTLTKEEHQKIFNYWMDKITPKGRESESKDYGSWLNFPLPFPRYSDDIINSFAHDYLSNSYVKGLFEPLHVGPVLIESFTDDCHEEIDQVIVCCKYCNKECEYDSGFVNNWFCNTCGYTRYADETYSKTIKAKIPKIHGIFDWHRSSIINP